MVKPYGLTLLLLVLSLTKSVTNVDDDVCFCCLYISNNTYDIFHKYNRFVDKFAKMFKTKRFRLDKSSSELTLTSNFLVLTLTLKPF